ncbi:hypothetical protein JW948_14935 [bacterium]|nr:hypothetical protein [bacterium]
MVFKTPPCIQQFRNGFLNHVDAMFGVLEELEQDSRGTRTGLLSDDHWSALRTMLHTLEPDFYALLVSGIMFHDIGKMIQKHDHAALGIRMLQGPGVGDSILNSGLIRELMPGRTPKPHFWEWLQLLVMRHEVCGNFFTGEQSWLAWENVIRPLLEMPGISFSEIRQFVHVLVLLTVTDVGSIGEHTLLFNTRIRRYLTGVDRILKRIHHRMPLSGNSGEAFRCFLLEQDQGDYQDGESELVRRILCLTHGFAQHIDAEYPNYRKAVEAALAEVMAGSGDDESRFSYALARIRKLAYALRWFESLSGKLRSDGMGKPEEDLEDAVRLLWILCRPAEGNDRIFEIQFPPEVNQDHCRRLKEMLRNAPLSDITGPDPGEFGSGHEWVPWPDFRLQCRETDGEPAVVLIMLFKPH